MGVIKVSADISKERACHQLRCCSAIALANQAPAPTAVFRAPIVD